MSPIETLLLQIKAAKLPKPQREYRFHPERKWRFDLVWLGPDYKESDFTWSPFAVEVDGGIYIQGGHVRGAAYERDREKDAEAMVLGWRVLRVTPNQIKSGKALRWIEALL